MFKKIVDALLGKKEKEVVVTPQKKKKWSTKEK